MTTYRRLHLTNRADVILNHIKRNNPHASVGGYISRLIEQDRGTLGLPDELAIADELWEINYRWMDGDRVQLARLILPITIDAEVLSKAIAQSFPLPLLVEGYRHPDREPKFKFRLE